MKKTILLTRPRASSEKWARLLESQGFDCVIEPLMLVAPTYAEKPAGAIQAVLITSANALEILQTTNSKEQIVGLLGLPCFCVGATTNEAARICGFTDIRQTDGDGEALAHLVADNLKEKTKNLLHIAGEIISSGMQEILTQEGFSLLTWPIYRAEAIQELTPRFQELWAKGKIDIVPVFSPRSAQILVSLIEKNQLTQACAGITAIGLSQAVGDVLEKLPWRHLSVAAKPQEDEVLILLKKERPMTEDKKDLEPSSEERRTCPRQSGFLTRCLWVFLLLATISCLALTFSSGRMTPLLVPNQEIASLQQRVDNLEARLNKENAPPSTSANEAPNLAGAIHDLDTRLVQIEKQNNQNAQSAQKIIAEAFSFWDLREVIQTGAEFTQQLAALRSAAADDVFLMQQAAKLEPYAAQGVPTYAQLRESLAQQEQKPTLPIENPDENPWWARFKKAMQSLISIRPLHDARFASLESAIEEKDSAVAEEAVKNLPPETQQSLASWKEKLDARVAVDEIMRAMQARFTAQDNPS